METGSNWRVAHRKGAVGGGVAAARRCSGGRNSAPMAPRAAPVCRGSLRPEHKERRRVRWAVGGERQRGKQGTCNGGAPERKKASARAEQEVKASLLIGARPGGADTAARAERCAGVGRHRRERQWRAETSKGGGLRWGSVLVRRAFVRAWIVRAAGGGAATAATNQERGCGNAADVARDRWATGPAAPKEARAWQARRGAATNGVRRHGAVGMLPTGILASRSGGMARPARWIWGESLTGLTGGATRRG
jgi:hypothetical protein